MSGSSSDDDDFQFGANQMGQKRFPVHDCCEFEDADSLKVRSSERRRKIGAMEAKIKHRSAGALGEASLSGKCRRI
jgi:hypothetical protein